MFCIPFRCVELRAGHHAPAGTFSRDCKNTIRQESERKKHHRACLHVREDIDEKALRKLSEYIPDFSSYEHNRLSLYREAEKEAEEIFDRWADCVDEDEEDDYEPEEYFSD